MIAYLLSFSLHLLIFLFSFSLIRVPPAAPKKLPPLQVELVKNESKGKAAANPQKAKPRPQVSLKNLGIPLGGLEVKKDDRKVQGKDLGLLDEAGRGTGDGYKAVTDKNFPLYKYLYQLIENNLTYPSELIDAGFQGTVIAQLHFDQTGAYLRAQSVFQTSDSYLKVLVIRTLGRALADSIPVSLNRIKKPFKLNCSFRFYITQNGDQDLANAQKLIFGNKLYFYRSFYKSKLAWDLGPLSGLGPFTAAINPLWFLEKGRELLSKNAKTNPLQKYKDDPEW